MTTTLLLPLLIFRPSYGPALSRFHHFYALLEIKPQFKTDVELNFLIKSFVLFWILSLDISQEIHTYLVHQIHFNFKL